MDLFWKSVSATLIAVVFCLTLKKWEHNFSLLLTIVVCCMVGAIVLSFLVPIIDFMMQLETMCDLGNNTLQILIKVVGISFVGEFVSLICTDAGNGSLAKMVVFLTNSVVLWMSIPILHQFVDILKQILGAE